MSTINKTDYFFLRYFGCDEETFRDHFLKIKKGKIFSKTITEEDIMKVITKNNKYILNYQIVASHINESTKEIYVDDIFKFLEKTAKDGALLEQCSDTEKDLLCKKYFDTTYSKFAKNVDELINMRLLRKKINEKDYIFAKDDTVNQNYKEIACYLNNQKEYLPLPQVIDIFYFVKHNEKSFCEVPQHVSTSSAPSEEKEGAKDSNQTFRLLAELLKKNFDNLKQDFNKSLNLMNEEMSKKIEALETKISKQTSTSSYSSYSSYSYGSTYELTNTKKELSDTKYKLEKAEKEADDARRERNNFQNLLKQANTEKTQLETELKIAKQESAQKSQEILQLQTLLQQKERSEQLIKNGDVMNSETEQRVGYIQKQLLSLSNTIFNFLLSTELEDKTSSLFERVIQRSICIGFTRVGSFGHSHELTSFIIETIRFMMNDNNTSEVYVNNEAGVMKLISEIVPTLAQLNQNPPQSAISLDWFDARPELKEEKVMDSFTTGKGSKAQIEYLCLWPSLYVGQKVCVQGQVMKRTILTE